MRKITLCAVAGLALFSLTACQNVQTDSLETDIGIVESENINNSNDKNSNYVVENMAAYEDKQDTIFTSGGLEIPVPTKYIDSLVIKTPEETMESGIATLFVCREKASFEAMKTEFTDLSEDEMGGVLIGIARIDETAYEEMLSYEYPGVTLFAQDENNYYVAIYPTDVQYYRSSGDIDINSADWKSWTELMNWADTLPDKILECNPKLIAVTPTID